MLLINHRSCTFSHLFLNRIHVVVLMKISDRCLEVLVAIHFIDLHVRIGFVLNDGMKLIFPDMLSVPDATKKVKHKCYVYVYSFCEVFIKQSTERITS